MSAIGQLKNTSRLSSRRVLCTSEILEMCFLVCLPLVIIIIDGI